MDKTIAELAELNIASPYNAPGKKIYMHAAARFMRQLADELGLDVADYDINTEQAGIGVPGDITLHHERIYVAFGDCLSGMLGLARTCKGRKDYTGGSNTPIMVHTENDWLIDRCKELLRRP